jgi:hypothetical protein
VQLIDEWYSIESATSKRASKEALKTFRLTATIYALFGKIRKKKKKRYSQIWRLHLAQELDDAHARPSFVFADWLAELHSLYPAKGKINPHENFNTMLS